MTFVAAVAWLGASVAAQDAPSVRAGTPGVPVPVLIKTGEPEYPFFVLNNRTSGVVTLDASLSRDGRVQEVRALDPPPDPSRDPRLLLLVSELGSLRDSALAYVRKWEFEPRAGGPSIITVPVTVRFEVLPYLPVPSFFGEGAPSGAPPADFELVYTYGRTCRLDTRAGSFSTSPPHGGAAEATVPFQLSDDDRASIYREMVRVGFFDYGFDLKAARNADDLGKVPGVPPPAATFEVRQDGIVATVSGAPGRGTYAQPSAVHLFQVTRSGRQTAVFWDDAYVGPAITREIEGVRSVIRVVQSIIRSSDGLGDLAAIRTACRGPM
jgi:hypothetical protein